MGVAVAALLALLALPSAERCTVVQTILPTESWHLNTGTPTHDVIREKDLPELGQYISRYFRKVGCERVYMTRVLYGGTLLYELEIVDNIEIK